MWTANAATVCPSTEATDGRVHFTPANLLVKPHRAIESHQTQKILKDVFYDKSIFVIHDPVAFGDAFSDEGAANHTRFVFNGEGYHFFVYGREALKHKSVAPKIFPARQTLEASQAVARIHRIPPHRCFFAQQNPRVIDEGVFHNDVISVGHQNILFYHELAFLKTPQVISHLQDLSQGELIGIKVMNDQVDLKTAVDTFLFNSQIVTMPEGHLALIATNHCKEDKKTHELINHILRDQSHPLKEVLYFDLLQSMKNGGGPACLRLRVPLTEEQIQKVNPKCLLSESKYKELVKWVNCHYREELRLKDLLTMSEEVKRALQELSEIMGLSHTYSELF